MLIAPDLLEQIVDHARRDFPNECCGLIALRDGRAVEVFPARNVEESPFRFNVHPDDLLQANLRIDELEADIGIYHSHTRSAPEPSQTDIKFAEDWPGAEWLIVGIDRAGELDLRSWRIDDGEPRQVVLEVSDA